MGGGHSVETVTAAVNKSVLNAITKVVQAASAQATAIQTINIDCRDAASSISERLTGTNELQGCLNIFKDRPLEDIKEICGSLVTCGANGITITGGINVNLNENIKNNVVMQVTDNIRNDIKSLTKQETGLFEFSAKENDDVKDFVNATQTIIGNFIQNDLSTVSQTQQIELKNVSLHVASLNDVIDLIQKNVIENDAYIKAVSTISNNIVSTARQSRVMQGPLTILFSVFGIVIGVLVIFGLILWIIKRIRK